MAAFRVLAEEQRRRILDLLLEAERSVGEVASRLTISQPAVSKHLRVLRHAGLVDSRTEAQRRIYRLSPEALREVDDWLAPYRPHWARGPEVEVHGAFMPDDDLEIGGTPV